MKCVRLLIAGALALMLGGCTKESPSLSESLPEISRSAPLPPVASGMEYLHPLGMQILENSMTATRQLQLAIEQLLQAPNRDRLLATREKWEAAVSAQENFYVFALLGLIDKKQYNALLQHHYRLLAWPVQPGYLDSFGDYAAAGIVYDVGLPLTIESLRHQHGLTDPGDVALGFYALEFVLFGLDNNRDPNTLTPIATLSPKQRQDGYEHVDELPENRRRQLITLQAQLLAESLLGLHAAWQPVTADTPGHHFAGLSTDERVTLMLRAALAMLTDHIITVTEHTKSRKEDDADRLRQGRQLAGRLADQLRGWEMVLQQAQVPSSEKLTQLTEECLDELDAIVEQPMTGADGNVEPIDWRDTYSSLSTLANSVRRLTQGYEG